MEDFEQLHAELLALPQVNGLVPVDILNLPHALGRVIRGLVRDKSITSAELADAVGISEQEAITVADLLVDKGYLLVVDDPALTDDEAAAGSRVYRIRFARIKKHNISIDL